MACVIERKRSMASQGQGSGGKESSLESFLKGSWWEFFSRSGQASGSQIYGMF